MEYPEQMFFIQNCGKNFNPQKVNKDNTNFKKNVSIFAMK